ncbi:hypothetical protein [Paraburkholderia sp.]|uniref:hypothetical protein n=1 Tax=Paraburkholderia sp. TaxID=1926495 RepID=UPI0025D2F584|nr:hypothetical protein [Paraburkholderia sp.]
MSTKHHIRFQAKQGDQPGWDLYVELFEPDDVVYLELEGVQADLTMMGNLEHAACTLLLRLPVATAKQLGLVPPAWDRDDRWPKE